MSAIHVVAGNSSSPDESVHTSVIKTRTAMKGDSWEMFRDRDGRPFWRNSRTGHWVYQNTTVAPSFSCLLVPPPGMAVQPSPMPGYSPYLATPGVYAAAPQQQWTFVPSPTSVIMPVVPVSSLVHYKKTDMGDGTNGNKSSKEKIDGDRQSVAKREGDARIEGTQKPVNAKTSGKYYVWERCDDNEEGKPVWVNTITGKRTNVDPYW